MGAVVVLITAMPDNWFKRRYKRDGYFSAVLVFYVYIMLQLICTHLLGIAALASFKAFVVLLALVTTETLELAVFVVICYLVHWNSENMD